MLSHKLLLSSILLFSFQFNSFGQCGQKLSVSDPVLNKQANTGGFDLRVDAGGDSYEGQVVKISGTNQTVLESFSGSSDKTFSFDQITLGDVEFVRVVVEFKGENEFLCRRRIVDVEFTEVN